MKKILFCGILVVLAVFSIHALDSEKAEKAVMKQDYIPALMEYGFTEQQIRSWATVGNTLTGYLAALQRNGRNERRDTTAMMIQIAIYTKEITENDWGKIDQFLKDIEEFWVNKVTLEEESANQRVQEAEQQRQLEQDKQKQVAKEQQLLEQERRQQELTEYASSFGLLDYVDGIVMTLMEITSSNFELVKKAMIIPSETDQQLSVQNIVDGYVIYSVVRGGTVYQVAMIAEQGKTYPSNSQLDVNYVYKIDGTQRFARLIGGTTDIIVISRLGQKL